MAVKVTLPPEHILVEDALIVTEGVTVAVVTVIAFDVAFGVVVQVALLVITTVTTSLLFNVVVIKVAAVCPATAVPFTIHW